MIIKLKTVEQAISVAKQRLAHTYGYKQYQLASISENALLDYIPKEYFGSEHLVTGTETQQGETWYYIGLENWAVPQEFVESISSKEN